MALVEGDLAVFDDAGDDAGFCFAGSDGADAAFSVGDGVSFGGHAGGGEEGVLAAVHGGAAGVGGLAVEVDGVAFDAVGAEDGAEREVEVEEDGALLDVEFLIGGGIGEFDAAGFDVVEVDAFGAEGVGEGDAVFVFEGGGFGEVEVAGAGGGTEEAFAEAGAFFVCPIDESDGDGWAIGVGGGEMAEDGEGGEGAEAAVEPAAVGDGVDVAADDEGAFGLAGEGGPEVAGLVAVGFDAGDGVDFLLEPGAGGAPDGGEGYTLGAVFVPCERAEFFEFGDGGGGIE